VSGIPAGPFAAALLASAGALLAMMAVTFPVANRAGKHSVVDTAWGIGLALAALAGLLITAGHGQPVRRFTLLRVRGPDQRLHPAPAAPHASAGPVKGHRMETAIVVFTRDLRLRDNPALQAARAAARQVLPVFVLDPAISAPPNRGRFLAESLADLRRGLRERGGDLVVRRGEPAAEVIRLAGETGAGAVFIAGGVSRYAARRRRELERACAGHRLGLSVTPGLTVVPPGELRPAGSSHYRVPGPPVRGEGLCGAGLLADPRSGAAEELHQPVQQRQRGRTSLHVRL
jgi:DNA photolyase